MPASSPDRARVRALLIELLPPAVDRSAPNPVIFGPGGGLDSLGLVNYLADVEMQLLEAYGAEVVLASERAMSRGRSPFRDVDALTDLVLERLSAAVDGEA